MRSPVLLVLLLLVGCQKASPRVVLYCAQDREFALPILSEFTKQTGIEVEARYDTESTKSVSLFEALLREKDRPRCDVFWNNEVILTLRLDEQNLLEPYSSPAAADYPPWTKTPTRTWQAFAARARIFLVRNDVLKDERPKRLEDLTQPQWKGKVAMAKPMFGTTATQMACLAASAGETHFATLMVGLKANVTILPGNKDVAEAVSAGRYQVGLTDTDDAIIEVRRGQPVSIVYPGQPEPGTLFLPNTVCLLRGGPNPDAGRKLIDFLLSPEVERALAEGPSAQIPLNPKVQAKLEIKTPAQITVFPANFLAAAQVWDRTQAKLRDLFAR